MAGRNLVQFKIDAREVAGLADRLASATDAAGLAREIAGTLNQQVQSAYKLSKDSILSGINLTEPFVDSRMEVRPASEKNFTAETNLSHYGAQVGDRKVNWTNEWIDENIGKFGPWPGWTRRQGNPGLEIEADRKAYKVSAEVTRGSRKSVGHKFMIPGIVNKTDGTPVVFRNVGPGGKGGKGRIEPVHGPSVYQLFRHAMPLVEKQVADDLQSALLNIAETEFQKVIE